MEYSTVLYPDGADRCAPCTGNCNFAKCKDKRQSGIPRNLFPSYGSGSGSGSNGMEMDV